MGRKTKELISILDDLIIKLNAQNESHWSQWMSIAKEEIQNSDFHGIEKILSAYGGMGSISDMSENKDLISKVYDLATAIKKEQ